MDSIKNSIHKVYKGAAEQILPVRSQSAFKEQGVLTPDEFVAAGNHLVRTCPTWSWEAGDAGSKWSFLPKDKQFLITRTVPCHRRAAAVEGFSQAAEQLLETQDGEAESWVAPEADSGAGPSEQPPEIPAIDDEGPSSDEVPDMDDVPDIDDLTLAEEDDEGQDPTDSILRTRTYDLLISYDKYYQVPRFWLVGYDEDRQPLPASKVLEDVSEEHARKTITVEKFPHMPMITAASIHPCKHAVTMKKLSSMMETDSHHITVDRYLILFLKFIASVVPTIEYDYTMAAGL
eukprot:jgi/Astpho2/7150/fgenesh1_pm.00113_%23_2_t